MIKHSPKKFQLTFAEMGDHVPNLNILKQNEKMEMYKMSKIKETNSALARVAVVSKLNEYVARIKVI